MKKTFFYGYVILFILFVLQIFMCSPRGSFGVFVKPIADEFDWSRTLISGSFSLSSLMQGFAGILMGWLNDRIGPRFVITICGILVGGGLMLMYLIDSAWQLYLFYVVPVGIGLGALFSPQMSTAARWFTKRRNLVTGIIFAGGGVGGLIGPPLITWIIYTYNWQKAFLFVGLAILVIMLISAQFLKRDPSQVGQVPYGEGSETKDKITLPALGQSIKQALATGNFWLMSYILFCVGICLTVPAVHIVPLAIDRGISPEHSAVILSAFNIAMPLGCIVIGMIVDKIGSGKALVTSISLTAAIVLLMFPITSAWLLGFLVVVVAFGCGGLAVINSSLVAELFGMKSHGGILGCLMFMWVFGGAAGSFFSGWIFDSTGSYQLVFIICGILVAIAIIMAVFLNQIRKTQGLSNSG
jgi:MFS transporter, OFA family, oxalate/formate antiporter